MLKEHFFEILIYVILALLFALVMTVVPVIHQDTHKIKGLRTATP
jgi:hypothetical protein